MVYGTLVVGHLLDQLAAVHPGIEGAGGAEVALLVDLKGLKNLLLFNFDFFCYLAHIKNALLSFECNWWRIIFFSVVPLHEGLKSLSLPASPVLF